MTLNEINQHLKQELYSIASKQFIISEISSVNFSDNEREAVLTGACGCCRPSCNLVEQD